MTYKLVNIERRVGKSGKPYATLFLADAEGHEHKANAFEGFDAYAVGASVEGELRASGDFLNFKPAGLPKPAQSAPGSFTRSSSKARDVEVAQERREAGIALAQEAKEAGIRVSLAMRMACDVALASLKDQPFPSDEEFKAEYKKWYDYYERLFGSEVQRIKDQPF